MDSGGYVALYVCIEWDCYSIRRFIFADAGGTNSIQRHDNVPDKFDSNRSADLYRVSYGMD